MRMKQSRKQRFTVEALEDRLALTASVAGAGIVHAALIQAATTPGPGLTQTSLNVSTTHAVYGQPVTLISTVAPTAPGAAATGNVSFFDGAVFLGDAPIVNGSAKLITWAGFLVGPNPISAAYWGDSNYTQSTSGTVDVEVTKAATLTTLSTSAGTSLTATVGRATPGGGVPTGVVAFYDHGKLLGSVFVINGRATIGEQTNVGTHAFTAVYYGDSNFNPSVSAHKIAAVTHHTSVTVATPLVSPNVPHGFWAF